MTEEVIVRRLSLIKHLYRVGLEKAALPETISFSSILLLHDAIDMFMHVAAEKQGIKKGKQNIYLMDYFELIPELTLKASVNKINKRRNTLKHDGIVPGKIEIDDTCSIAKYFFDENTKIIFDKDFNEVSIFDLITFEKVREFLKAANTFYEVDKFEEAADEVAKSYFHLLEIEKSLNKTLIKNPWYGSDNKLMLTEDKFYAKAFEPFLEGQEFKEKRVFDDYVEISEGVASLADHYQKAFSYIFESLTVFALGLDYKKYNHFQSFMPMVYGYTKHPFVAELNSYHLAVRPHHPKNITKENIHFAIDFVMEFALKIQEFKY